MLTIHVSGGKAALAGLMKDKYKIQATYAKSTDMSFDNE
jgi:hypothetical protein